MYSSARYNTSRKAKKMVFLGQVLVFSISTCPFCRRAKKFLSDLRVPYVDVNLEKYPERRYEMEEKTGRRTVPQIFFNSKHIGGYDDLKKLVSHSSRIVVSGLALSRSKVATATPILSPGFMNSVKRNVIGVLEVMISLFTSKVVN